MGRGALTAFSLEVEAPSNGSICNREFLTFVQPNAVQFFHILGILCLRSAALCSAAASRPEYHAADCQLHILWQLGLALFDADLVINCR